MITKVLYVHDNIDRFNNEYYVDFVRENPLIIKEELTPFVCEQIKFSTIEEAIAFQRKLKETGEY